ncbi:MAG: hypothetical protein EOP33_01970 [Rickettsiaceae bacterium]|nr:MAG: hypothetical protein EOP33_01970 [Rickettsiaceae bacterium]
MISENCHYLLDFLVDEKIISRSQLYYIFLIQILNNHSSIYDLLIAENIVSNECLVKVLCKLHNRITDNQPICKVTRITDYRKINHYIKQSYFEYIDSQGINSIAVNSLRILPKIYKLKST